MSWDKTEYDEFASCACGKGKVVRHCWEKDDDWNRFESGYSGEEILCQNCSKSYHIEHLTRHFFELPWKGNGSSDRTFLVPNGNTIPNIISRRDFNTYDFEKSTFALYEKEELVSALKDMRTHKFSTKVELQSTKNLILCYFKQHKKKSLPPIIEALESIISRYDEYEWTKGKIAKYKEEENIIIKNNESDIKRIIDISHELVFRR